MTNLEDVAAQLAEIRKALSWQTVLLAAIAAVSGVKLLVPG